MKNTINHKIDLYLNCFHQVFGEMSYVPGLTKDIKKAINSGAKKLEDLVDFGSKTSINMVQNI